MATTKKTKTTKARATKKTTTKKTTTKKATTKRAAPAIPKDAGTIPLKKICAELGIDANCATREKLRRVWRNEEATGHAAVKGHGYKRRWFFSPAEAKTVKAILSPAK
jgi:hypothetical protein